MILHRLISLLAGLLLACPLAAAAGIFERLSERRYPFRAEQVQRPYFDAAGQLQWDQRPLAEGAQACHAPEPGLPWQEAPRCRLRTLALAPRVDECRCEGRLQNGQGALWLAYQGGDGATWRRDRCEPASARCVPLAAIGPDGLLFSDHERWSPHGTTLAPAQPRLPQQWGASLYLPQQQAFLEFEGEADLLSSRGGYWLAPAAGGERRLLQEIDASPFGHWRAEHLVQLPGSHLVAVAERWSTRGPGQLRLVLLDPRSGRRLAEQTVHERCSCHSIKLLPGPAGQLALSFFSPGEYLLLHYRVHLPQGD